MTAPSVTPWPHNAPPTDEVLERALRDEGLAPSWWSNGPGDRYGAHAHPYRKVLYCARGSIRFLITSSGEEIDLGAGDRLDIPPGTSHAAVVGPEGVSCVEAARR